MTHRKRNILEILSRLGRHLRHRRTGVRRHGPFSSLLWRILLLNAVAPAVLVAGLLYLDRYRQGLVTAEMNALQVQGEIFAVAIGESAVTTTSYDLSRLDALRAESVMRRLAPSATRSRARLFDADGVLLADTRMLLGPGGLVQREKLPPPEQRGFWPSLGRFADRLLDRLDGWIFTLYDLPPYREGEFQSARDFDEVAAALHGETAGAIRSLEMGDESSMILSVAVPVQQYKQVVGAVMVSTRGDFINTTLRSVRRDIVRAFGLALAVTVLLSLYLAGTIARPLRRLAQAADQVRHGQGRHKGREVVIPDLTGRRDEIGDLSLALREMTAALWARMDAIRQFAADVAHEIKNPLTSLRSAAETVLHVKDPARQEKLLNLLLEDVRRIDRLVSDISEASRLDAELARAALEPLDMAGMLETLADMHNATVVDVTAPHIALVIEERAATDYTILGAENRLVQLLRNLIANAVSFSPPGGAITCTLSRQGAADDDQPDRPGDVITVCVEDEGPGVPPENLETIFQRFYTERPEGEKFGTHSGLGLSISRQIAEAHEGRLTAENIVRGGKIAGARFVLCLPARRNRS